MCNGDAPLSPLIKLCGRVSASVRKTNGCGDAAPSNRNEKQCNTDIMSRHQEINERTGGINRYNVHVTGTVSQLSIRTKRLSVDICICHEGV